MISGVSRGRERSRGDETVHVQVPFGFVREIIEYNKHNPQLARKAPSIGETKSYILYPNKLLVYLFFQTRTQNWLNLFCFYVFGCPLGSGSHGHVDY